MSTATKLSFSAIKLNFTKTLYFLLVILLLPAFVSAQKTGDFRSSGTGKWSNTGTQSIWQQYHSAYTTSWKIAFQADLGADSVAMRSPGYNASSWVNAVVPGTVLTSYVAAGVVPEPGYGTNMDNIDTGKYGRNVWYRAEFTVPPGYGGKHIWLNFHGLNKYANIYVNNVHIGNQAGLMVRGKYDITKVVNPNGVNVIAILIYHMTANFNNLEMPSYIAGAGWDWMPPVPGFDRGITGTVFLSTTNQVGIVDPFMRTLALGSGNAQATLGLTTQLTNYSDTAQTGVLTTIINPGNIKLTSPVTVAANGTVSFAYPNYLLSNPLLWWPNGYGDPNLYQCKMTYTINGVISDSTSFNFGVRKFNYVNDKFGVLNVYVNGKKIFVKGGDWGMSEFMLRVHGTDYDARIRFHKELGLNMIRNWCGTETDDEFYDYCDKYGIMLWEEFWLNNGFTPLYDLPTYLANVPEKVKRERNHASVAIWCGSNEGIQWYDTNVEDTVKKYDMGDRLYQSASNASNIADNSQFGLTGQGGLSSDGGYSDLGLASYFTKTASVGHDYFSPNAVFVGNYGFHSELGLACFPSSESFKLFMPPADQWPSNNDWTYDHFFGATGRGDGASPSGYMSLINSKYGTATGLEDFCRKAQLVNIEEHKAMYESYTDHLWHDASGVMMWMSQAAFPTMIWQTYDYYLDCTGGYWGVKKACEPLHIQWSIASDSVKVINTTANDANNLTATFNIYNSDGSLAAGYGDTVTVSAKSDTSVFCFPGVNGSDLAYNKTAFASSSQAGTPAAAFDGNTGTRWGSNFDDDEYIGVDLGAQKTVGAVSFIWQSAYAQAFDVQVSNDMANWTTVYSTTTGTGGVENIAFTPVQARYVRMLGLKRATVFGYSLYEFYVYAKQVPTPLTAVYFLKMQLKDASGNLVSDNFYWRSNNEDYTSLNSLPIVPLQESGGYTKLPNGNYQVTLNLTNPAYSPGVAFAVHVQLKNGDGSRVLPVFMNDNYFSILKGETKKVTIEFPPSAITGGMPTLLVEQYNSRNPSLQVTTGALYSPDNNIELKLSVANNKVYYQVNYKNQTVMGPSPLGLTVNGTAVNQAASINTIQQSPTVNQSIATWGVHSTGSNNYNESLITFNPAAGATQVFKLDAKLFNNGVAFRYIVPGSGASTVTIDSTNFTIPSGSTIWSQGDLASYEGTYQQQTIDAVPAGQQVGPPLTIRLPSGAGYASITEGGNLNFAGITLKATGNNNFIANFGSVSNVTNYVETPWRIIEIGQDLNTLVNCDIVADVSPNPDATLFPNGTATNWLHPGQSLWSWIAVPGNFLPQTQVNYANMLRYAHLASQMGIAYNLLDQGWEKYFPTGTQTEWQVLKQLADSSRALNVKLWVWKPYQPQNNVFFPDPGIEDSTARRAFFTQCAQAGVAGLKIDYFTGEQQTVYAWQQAALKDAAQLNLMLDFHGAVKPTGQQHTWPNEMSQEAIRGLEHTTSTSYPSHNTTIPFTRFLAGFADYTPLSFRQDVIAGTTLAHQVATLIVFTSPFMCLAVNPDSLLVSPVKNIVTNLPTTWDETRVLPPSEVGQLAMFARRKGTTWYLGVLNGPNTNTLSIPLSFLGAGSYQTTVVADNPASVAKAYILNTNYTNSGTINVTLQSGGGLVAKFTAQ
jgi:hypothetical protein